MCVSFILCSYLDGDNCTVAWGREGVFVCACGGGGESEGVLCPVKSHGQRVFPGCVC